MGEMKIRLSNPDITDLERTKVIEVLSTPDLSLGPKLEEFEHVFAGFVGAKYAAAVNSGTSGLHLCVRALGIGDYDEVITSPFSFIASANCLLFERARPIFVDIDEKTLNINMDLLNEVAEKKFKKGDPLKALLPVHVFGRPCEMDQIMATAGLYHLHVIEDACEALGAQISTDTKTTDATVQPSIKKWRKVGTFGDCSVFGFYPNKQITTGEGGMVVSNDEKLICLIKSMRNQGRSQEAGWLQHQCLGYNYRISDINCALGIAQLERIEDILQKRENVAHMYFERLKNNQDVVLPYIEENYKISWFVFVIRLNDSFSREDRDYLLKKMREKGVGCGSYFSPIHLQPFYRRNFGTKQGDFPVTEKVSERTIALPFYNNLNSEQVDYVCDILNKSIKSLS